MKYTGYFTGLLLIVAGAFCVTAYQQALFVGWGYFLILLGFLRLIYTFHLVQTKKKEEIKDLQIDEILKPEEKQSQP